MPSCEWDQADEGNELCPEEGKEFKLEQTDSTTGEVRTDTLGYLCPTHAMEWIRTHITPAKEA